MPVEKTNSALLRSAGIREGRIGRMLRSLLLRRRNADPAAMAQGIADPRVFQPTDEGSGVFGRWVLDDAGLPAYEYTIDQYQEPAASYQNSEERDRRDHWHQVGNHRVTGLASNDGTVQVYLGDRGGVFLNRFEAWEYDRPARDWRLLLFGFLRWLLVKATRFIQRSPQFTPFAAQAEDKPVHVPRGIASPEILERLNVDGEVFSAQEADDEMVRYGFAGGFGYLDDGMAVWSTAFRYRPSKAKTRRVFGMGYYETEMIYRGVRVVRRVYAPYGDFPGLAVDIEIENLGESTLALKHYEYWDVNVQQLQLEWLRSGRFGAISDRARRRLCRLFDTRVSWDAETFALRFSQQVKTPPPEGFKAAGEPSEIDWHPADVFLADLSGEPDAYYVDKRLFFGDGGARQPDAVRERRAGDTAVDIALGGVMPYCMVLRRDVQLAPGEKRHLKYAYGAVRPGETLGLLETVRNSGLMQTAAHWRDNLVYFTTGDDPVLQRELAWHSYNMSSAVVYNEFYGVRLVPQGSAYLYLHGADGAPRDMSLFAVPMTYLNPAVACDMLRLIMRLTDAKIGQIAYSFAGHGVVSDGMGLHNAPSDLDLFFLLAMSEYLAATADFEFLAEDVPFYPPGVMVDGGKTVLDHIRRAVRHLLEDTGTGDHGLLRVGSGDWSDSIVLENALRDGVGPFGVTYQNSKRHGESVPNTQMALYVLPLIAAIIQPHDPALAEYIYAENRLGKLRDALAQQWHTGGWYHRAVLRNRANQPVTLNHLDLEAQPWALISGAARENGKEAALLETVNHALDNPSPIGAALVPGGMVWPAISQLVTWAYARCGHDELAWRSLNRNTFAVHSYVYPEVWFNTWSGPDGINGLASDHPGGSWSSPLTPMMDFPVMNANQDAMALLGLLRVCGVEPAPEGDGLAINPHVPREHFVLDTPLLRLEVTPGRIAGEYRAVVDGSRRFYVTVPDSVSEVMVSINHEAETAATPVNGRAVLTCSFQAGTRTAFSVRW